MKFLKRWPYWAKGGLSTFFLLFLLSIIFGVGENYCKAGIDCYSSPIAIWIGYLVSPLERILDSIDSLFPKFLLLGVYYFVIGAVIGWFYSKIKNRNQKFTGTKSN